MKKKIWFTLGLAMWLVSCGQKAASSAHSEETIKASVQAADDLYNLEGVQQLDPLHMEETVVVNERQYRYEITRTPSDDMPLVAADYSPKAKFKDNIATLKIWSGDRQIFNKSFSKKDFANLVESDMLNRSILRGFAYETEFQDGLQFVMSVGYPQDDEMYVPLMLRVKSDGTSAIERHPLMDTPSYADDSSEEGV